MKGLRLAVQTIGLAFSLQTPIWSQSPCPAPDTHQVVPGVNIFNAQQQVYLGEAIDASLRQELVIETDPVVTARLQAIVDHLAEVLPTGQPKFQVALVELPTANAFSTLGGRLYVSRKLIALTQNEDELAYVLAHEMGHLVSQHTAIAISDGFMVVLGVKQVGDQKDVVDKWNEYLSNRRRVQASGGNVRRAEKIEQATQVQADAISVYLVTRGGYDSHSAAAYFDRLAETKGNVGGFWSDLFGKTSEDSKRLREMLQNPTPMPASCVQPRPGAATGYIAWRDSVINFTPSRNAEIIPGLIRKRALTQRLPPAINAIRISPDGKYVLAQDDSGMFVLSRQPLKSIFHILAWDAKPAMFTPDSQSIVYSIGGFGESPRVEKWNIASQQRTEVHEIHVGKGCLNPSLSPDGKNLACIIDPGSRDTFRLDLVVYDTATGTEVWRRNNWWSPGIMTGGYWESLNLIYGAEKRWERELPIRLENGKVQSTTVLDTGKDSFRPESIRVVGSRLIIADNQNRVSVYSLEGKRLASFPGHSFHFTGDLLLIDEDSLSERLSLYDLSTFETRAQYVFGSPVVVSQFSGDGRQLLIATADQTVYVLDPNVSSTKSNLPGKQ